MSKVAVFFAEGFEEIEALTVVDILRRAAVEVDMVSIADKEYETGSHKITVKMDKNLTGYDFDAVDMLVLPGGIPGTPNLEACGPLMEKITEFYNNKKYIAAICAAPSIFGHKGFLKGRKACCYPSFESHLTGALVSENSVELDGNVLTSRGMGTAIDFSLAILEIFAGKQKADELAGKIVYR